MTDIQPCPTLVARYQPSRIDDAGLRELLVRNLMASVDCAKRLGLKGQRRIAQRSMQAQLFPVVPRSHWETFEDEFAAQEEGQGVLIVGKTRYTAAWLASCPWLLPLPVLKRIELADSMGLCQFLILVPHGETLGLEPPADPWILGFEQAESIAWHYRHHRPEELLPVFLVAQWDEARDV